MCVASSGSHRMEGPMAASYVIVMESPSALVTRDDLQFQNDVAAFVTARRMFLQALLSTRRRPIAVRLGKRAPGGPIDWLEAWRAACR
jgi:hypothetical protein